MRLEKGEDRIRFGEREREAQARLGRHGFGRKPHYPQFSGVFAPRRSDCARNADRRGGARVESPASECSASNSFITRGPSSDR
jgi:hypothetical protein